MYAKIETYVITCHYPTAAEVATGVHHPTAAVVAIPGVSVSHRAGSGRYLARAKVFCSLSRIITPLSHVVGVSLNRWRKYRRENFLGVVCAIAHY